MAIPAITNNSPVAGSIAWGAFTIQYNGVGYQISAGSTAQRWVWWRYNGGSSVIEAGADIPQDLTDDDLVLFGNKNGLGIRVQATSLIDGELLVDGSIFADALSANLINSTHIVTAGLDAAVVKFGTMSGARIAVGTLAGDRVTANSIGTSKLMVASMDNLLSDPTFIIPTLGSNNAWGTGTGVALSPATGQSGGNTLAFTNAASAQASINYPLDVPVEGGASFRLHGRVMNAGGAIPINGARFRMEFKNALGVTTNIYMGNSSIIPADTWAVFSGMITAPADAVSYRVWVRSESSLSVGVLHWDYVQMTRAANGALIVDGSITAIKIAADTITANEIAADAITATELAAGSIVAGKIAAGAVTADKLDAEAVTADHLQGKYISGAILDIEDALYAEPGYLDVKAQLLEAQSGIFHDNVTRRGVNNYLEGRETAAAGVSDPGTPPTVTNVWPFVQLMSSGGDPVALGPANASGTAITGNELAIASDSGLVIYNVTTGAFIRQAASWSFLDTVYGMCRIGDWYYVARSLFMQGRVLIHRFSALAANEGVQDATYEIDVLATSNVASTGALALAPVSSSSPSLIAVMWISDADGTYRFRTYNESTKALVTATATMPGAAPGVQTTIAGLDVSGLVGYTVYVQPGEKPRAEFGYFSSWSATSLNRRALPYDGSVVGADGDYTLDTKGRLFKHAVSGTNSDGVARDYTYTWVDSDAGGTGIAESKPSPARTFTIAKGAHVNIKTPYPPDDGTTDAPNTVKTYVNNSLQDPIGLPAEYSEAELATGRSLSIIDTSGAAAPETSGFAARPQTLPGGYQSTKGDADGAIWSHYGDGSGRAGKHLKWDGNGEWLGEGQPSITLVPTMSVAGHSVRIKEILPGVVICWGYLDVDDTNATRRDTGMVIPVGMRPAAQLIDASPQTGRTGWYRYFFGSDGMIEFEQSGGTNAPFEGFSVIWTTT